MWKYIYIACFLWWMQLGIQEVLNNMSHLKMLLMDFISINIIRTHVSWPTSSEAGELTKSNSWYWHDVSKLMFVKPVSDFSEISCKDIQSFDLVHGDFDIDQLFYSFKKNLLQNMLWLFTLNKEILIYYQWKDCAN